MSDSLHRSRRGRGRPLRARIGRQVFHQDTTNQSQGKCLDPPGTHLVVLRSHLGLGSTGLGLVLEHLGQYL